MNSNRRKDFYLFWSITGLAIIVFFVHEMIGVMEFPAHSDMGGNGTVVITVIIFSALYLILLSACWALVRLMSDDRARRVVAILVSLLMPVLVMIVCNFCLNEAPESPGISPPHAPR
jgi:uncharacterized membrane protein YhaH (DUF805 family)